MKYPSQTSRSLPFLAQGPMTLAAFPRWIAIDKLCTRNYSVRRFSTFCHSGWPKSSAKLCTRLPAAYRVDRYGDEYIVKFIMFLWQTNTDGITLMYYDLLSEHLPYNQL